MKHIFIIFILVLSLGFSHDIFAANYKSSIPLNTSPNTINSASNINRAQLLCTHVGNFKKNIDIISKKYGLQEDVTIIDTLILVEKMRVACETIQTTDIEKSDANEIITSIVEDLSILNKGIKKYLKLQISEINTYHDQHTRAAIKIATQLDTLTLGLERIIYKKTKLSSRDKEIVKHIKAIKKISRKLKNFGDIEISKKTEIRSALIRFIKDIRKEIQSIKNL